MKNGVKNFFYPNKGIIGAFAVWAIFTISTYLMILPSNPAFENILENPSVIMIDVALNLLIIYFFSCLSIWAYEKMKKR